MIPVTVLTGFLGSGKTTLLARLLRTPAFAQTAVVVNELGEIGLDHELLATSEDQIVALETGCLCCAVRGDLEATLADLVARRAAGTLAAFERIVIETSGAADPAPVLNAILAETGRGAGLALAGVTTAVDAVTALATLDREPQVPRQIAVADRLILTKTDLTGGAPPADLLSRLAALNPLASIQVAIRGALAPEHLVGTADRARVASAETATRWLAENPAAAHDAGLTAVAVRRDAPIPAVALTLLLEALADHLGSDLLRLKGLVNVAEHPERPAVIHGVQHVFHEPEWLDAWPSADHSSRLVLIGRGLSRLWIETLLDALAAEVAEIGAVEGAT